MNGIIRLVFLGTMATVLVGTSVFAQGGKTELKRIGREPEYVDSALFFHSRNEYEIRKGSVTLTVTASSVEYVKPPKPAGFDRCRDIQKLERMVEGYKGLWWDEEAGEKLMPLYLGRKDPGKAVELFEQMKSTGREPSLSMRRIYWQALMMAGKKATLREDLDKAVAGNDREMAACAYIARGDVLAGQYKQKDALLDGYLRVIVMFKDVESCRKEAFEKSIAALEYLGDWRAERLRKIMKAEFPE